MMRGQRTAIPFILLLAALPPAIGHPVVIHAGTLAWENNELRLVLRADAAADEHERNAAGRVLGLPDLLRCLLDSIEIVSHQGQRITAHAAALSADGRQLTGRYALPEGVTTLALRQVPSKELASLPRQIQLAWPAPAVAPRVESSPPGPSIAPLHLLQLTSGGNYAVIQAADAADPPDANVSGIDPFIQPVLRVLPNPTATRCRIQLDYPVALLTTWPDLLDGRDHRIASAMVRERRATIAQWVAQRMDIGNLPSGSLTLIPPGSAIDHSEDVVDRAAARVASPDGTPEHRKLAGPGAKKQPAVIERIDLIGPAGEILTDDPDGTFAVFTTRVRIQLALAPASPTPAEAGSSGTANRASSVPDQASSSAAAIRFAWHGFNYAVMRMPVILEADRPATLAGLITPFDATVQVFPGSRARVVVGGENVHVKDDAQGK